MIKNSYILLIFLFSTFQTYAQVKVAFPPTRMVYQRNEAGVAKVYVSGTYTSKSINRIEARLKTRPGEPGSPLDWVTIAQNLSEGTFSGYVESSGGRFDLEVRAMSNSGQVGAAVVVEKVGVGEVFLIVGHSNASAAASAVTGASSDLVNTVDNHADPSLRAKYLQTGSPDDLPELLPVQFCQTCSISPMGEGPWFWPKLGDLLVSALNVPVLFYSAAFGGSNIGYFYKSAYNIPFTHGFIRYDIRMPYVNIRNTLSKYVPKTGLRAVLSAHGVNDGDTTGAGFYYRSLKVIEKSRADANYNQLPWMIATSCYNNSGIDWEKTQAQNDLINTVPDVFRGADLNQIDHSGRYDGLHFNEYGQTRAAELWRDAIINPATNLISKAKSLMATPPPLPPPPLPVTLISFSAQRSAAGTNELTWTTADETNNDHFKVERSTDAVRFEVIGHVSGAGDSKVEKHYHYTDEKSAGSTVYYRLNQVDFDGTSTLSRILAVLPGDIAASYAYPNPASDIIRISGEQGEVIKSLSVFDLKGKQLLRSSGATEVDISSLPQGFYFLQIEMENRLPARVKIEKR